jgi:eukaryotic-like serine/threonine-protein kinase
MDLGPPKGGGYQVLDTLGAGGMGRVYLARRTDGRLVVLKTTLQLEDEERLRDEARLGQRLKHPHIVETLGLYEEAITLFGRPATRPVLVTAYVPGVNLVGLRVAGPLPPAAVCRMGVELARALGAIHDAVDERGAPLSMLHRDVTAGNVLVGYDGRARLIDLGIARSRESQALRTETGLLRGTLRYLAPELFDGGFHTKGTDLWALGVVLWEAALGGPAVRGSDAEAIGRICSGRLMGEEDCALVEPRLVRAIGHLLQKDQSLRVPSARDAAALFSMLARELGGDPVGELATAVTTALSHTEQTERLAARPAAAVLQSTTGDAAHTHAPSLGQGPDTDTDTDTDTDADQHDDQSRVPTVRATPAPTSSGWEAETALVAPPTSTVGQKRLPPTVVARPRAAQSEAPRNTGAATHTIDAFARRQTPADALLDYAAQLAAMEKNVARAHEQAAARPRLRTPAALSAPPVTPLPIVKGTLIGPATVPDEEPAAFVVTDRFPAVLPLPPMTPLYWVEPAGAPYLEATPTPAVSPLSVWQVPSTALVEALAPPVPRRAAGLRLFVVGAVVVVVVVVLGCLWWFTPAKALSVLSDTAAALLAR